MSFYGRLRTYYPAFGFFWLCVLRLVFKYVFEFRPNACAFIFPIVSLNLMNLPVTALVALLTQSAFNIVIFDLPRDTLIVDDLIFNALFVLIITVIAKFMYDANPVQQIVLMSLVYTGMNMAWPLQTYTPVSFPDTTRSEFALFMSEVFASIVIIFTTGPIKVYLDVKRGATTIKELSDGYEESQDWLHKKLGAQEDTGILPTKRPPERANLKKRNVTPTD